MPSNTIDNLLTGAKLKIIAPSLKIERANELAAIMAKILPVYGMYNKEVLPEFLAEIAHESQDFTARSENLNYSAQALANTWPTRFAVNSKAKIKVPNTLANTIQRQPIKIANAAYNGRMGNALGTNDGWENRGAGPIQLTGKDAFTEYLKFKQAGKGYKFNHVPDNTKDIAELLRTNDEWGIDSACWEFAVSKRLIDEAVANNFIAISRAINGGDIGREDRERIYKRALPLFI